MNGGIDEEYRRFDLRNLNDEQELRVHLMKSSRRFWNGLLRIMVGVEELSGVELGLVVAYN